MLDESLPVPRYVIDEAVERIQNDTMKDYVYESLKQK